MLKLTLIRVAVGLKIILSLHYQPQSFLCLHVVDLIVSYDCKTSITIAASSNSTLLADEYLVLFTFPIFI